MTDVASQGLRLQLGMETTFNTPVAATKRLRAMSVDLAPNLETDQFFAAGAWAPSSSALIREWVEGDLNGVLTYSEFVYALHMALGNPLSSAAPTTGADTSVLARDWIFAPAATDQLIPRSATLERGSSVYGVRVGGVVIPEFSFSWSRKDRIEVKGKILGTQLLKPFTPTTIASNATVPMDRVLPGQIDIYVDSTYAAANGASATKALRTFSGEFSLSDLFAGVWPVNSALPSSDGIVAQEASSEASMMFMADAAGLAFLDNTRAGQTVYVKFLAKGAPIDTVGATTFRNEFEVVMPVEVKSVDAFENNDGVYAIPWTFQPVDDGINPPIKFRLRNKMTAL